MLSALKLRNIQGYWNLNFLKLLSVSLYLLLVCFYCISQKLLKLGPLSRFTQLNEQTLTRPTRTHLKIQHFRKHLEMLFEHFSVTIFTERHFLFAIPIVLPLVTWGAFQNLFILRCVFNLTQSNEETYSESAQKVLYWTRACLFSALVFSK